MNATNFKDCNNKAQRYINDIRLEVEKAINIKLSPNDPNADRYKLIDNQRFTPLLKDLDSLGADSFILDTLENKIIGTLDYKLISKYQEISIELYQYSINCKGSKLKEGWTIDYSKLTDYVAFIGYVEGQKTVYIMDFYDLRYTTNENIESIFNLGQQQTIQRNIKPDSRGNTLTKCIKYSFKIDSKTFNNLMAICNGIYYSNGLYIEYGSHKDIQYYKSKIQVKKIERNIIKDLQKDKQIQGIDTLLFK